MQNYILLYQISRSALQAPNNINGICRDIQYGNIFFPISWPRKTYLLVSWFISPIYGKYIQPTYIGT